MALALAAATRASAAASCFSRLGDAGLADGDIGAVVLSWCWW